MYHPLIRTRTVMWLYCSSYAKILTNNVRACVNLFRYIFLVISEILRSSILYWKVKFSISLLSPKELVIGNVKTAILSYCLFWVIHMILQVKFFFFNIKNLYKNRCMKCKNDNNHVQWNLYSWNKILIKRKQKKRSSMSIKLKKKILHKQVRLFHYHCLGTFS